MPYRRFSLRRGRFPLVAGAAVLAALIVSVTPAHAATFVVTTLSDAGDGSLRQAVLDANATPGADTITFAAGLTGTITLDGPGDLVVNGELTIQGPGAGVLTVDPGESGRALVISMGGTARVSGLTFSGGTGLGLTGFPFPPFGGSTHGGAIVTAGNLTVTDAVFTGNTAPNGGAIANLGAGNLQVERTVFSANTGSVGSAIHNGESGGARIFDSTFTANSGSAAVLSTHLLTVVRSTFAGNFGTDAGAIYSTRSLGVSNSTFVGNSGFATIWTAGNTASIGAVTIVDNSAHGLWNPFPSPVILRNSIIANSGVSCFGGLTAESAGNLMWPVSFCPALLADPLLDPAGLRDNGGPTQTIALTPESPAVDAGSLPCALTDQRGVLRPQGVGCDIGAFELEQAASPDELIQDALDEVGLLAGSANAMIADKAEDARDKLNVALAELGKTPPDGVGALGAVESATGELEAMVADGLLSPAAGEDLLDALAEAGRLLATDAIDAAAGGDASKLAEANEALARGDALRDDGRYKDAIARYKDAYAKAESA